jgi:hypothetical protein
VRRVHRLPIHGDGESGRLHLLGNWRSEHASCGVSDSGKREKGNKEPAKTRQEMRLRRQSGEQTTLAPGAGARPRCLRPEEPVQETEYAQFQLGTNAPCPIHSRLCEWVGDHGS